MTALLLIAIASFAMSYAGAAVGVVLGQLRVVLLTFALGTGAGIGTSLAISTLANLAAALTHARGGRVHLRPLLLFGIPSAAAAYASARYSAYVDPRLPTLAIAVTLAVVGVGMLRAEARREPGEHDVSGASPSSAIAQVGLGAVLGAISGVVGLLMNTMRLPAMLRFGGVSAGAVVGTNMAIGALTGLSAGVAALEGGHINMLAFMIVCPVTLLGAHAGALRTGRLDGAVVRRWIGYLLLPTALLMGIQVVSKSGDLARSLRGKIVAMARPSPNDALSAELPPDLLP